MSDPARARELERLFQEALGLAPEERAAFLAARCGPDRELLARVQALLAEDAQGTRGVLRANVASAPAAAEERIGRYRLLRVLGEGGMGTVHLAEQEEPVRRLVALKTIRLGSFSPGAAARFAAECQALAEMNHPGIAKIFDAGVTEGGLPYLVMEYAPGLPLTEHCDQFRLSIAERLELLARVCDAVHHAHQKGIVHRDLKPGNVLVDVSEGRTTPRVIDFGIARALAGQLGSDPAAQPLVDRLGTPAYMSPARLKESGVGVDTRDDVYSLGVMLYQLLTSRYPYEHRTRAELARALEHAPPAPSARLAELGPELDEVARQRATAPRQLLGRVRGELDALTLCALAADPARRYASAAALAEDLRRCLRHEVLLGIQTSTPLRTRKFLRRHWVGATFAAVLFAMLVLALLAQRAAWLQAQRGRRAAEAAQAVAVTERVAAEDARAEAQRRRDFERGEREEADFLVRAFQSALLLAQAGEGTAEELSVAELLGVLADHVESVGRSGPGAEAALRAALGRCFLAIGAEKEALEQFLRANAAGGTALEEDALDRFEIIEGLIESLRRTGDLKGARVYVAQALELARSVFAGREARFLAALETLLTLAAGAEVDGAAAQDALALVLAALPDAIVRGDESGVTARILVEAAVQLVRQRSPRSGEFLAAMEQRARELLAPEDVRLVNFLWSLMHVRLQRGALVDADAVRAARELVSEAERRLPPGHWLRSDARRLLGQALRARGQLEEAEGELLAALDEARRAPNPSTVEARHAPSPSTVEARRAPSSGRRRMSLARDELAALARALDDTDDSARPGQFLARSYELHGPDPESGSPWWVALQPKLPARVFAAADELLRARGEPEADLQRALLLARAQRFEDALALFDSARVEAPLIARALRAQALAGLGRLAEARAEILQVAELRRASPANDPELEEQLDELRDFMGL